LIKQSYGCLSTWFKGTDPVEKGVVYQSTTAEQSHYREQISTIQAQCLALQGTIKANEGHAFYRYGLEDLSEDIQQMLDGNQPLMSKDLADYRERLAELKMTYGHPTDIQPADIAVLVKGLNEDCEELLVSRADSAVAIGTQQAIQRLQTELKQVSIGEKL